jgi:hypothetical protein
MFYRRARGWAEFGNKAAGGVWGQRLVLIGPSVPASQSPTAAKSTPSDTHGQLALSRLFPP